MPKTINAYTTAKAVLSAHKRWAVSPMGEAFSESLTKALAREGWRDVASTVQALRSQLGRMTDVGALVKSDAFLADAVNASRFEEYQTIRRALDILS